MKTSTLNLPVFSIRTAAIVTAWLALSQLAGAQSRWSAVVGTATDTNWSSAVNWTPSGVPGPTTPVRFDDLTGVASSSVNNVVDGGSFAGAVASLTYTNQALSQNTLILPGQTLKVATGGLTMGNSTALATAITATTTISGAGGTLVVSNGSVTVGQSFPSSSGTGPALDLSGLDTFVATNLSRILVGAGSSRMSGRLYLAKTNYINLTGGSPQLDIGDNSSNNGPGSILYLGQTNVILVDSIGMGLQKQSSGSGGRLLFNTALSNPVAYIRGTNGPSSAVSTWAISDGQSVSGTPTTSGTTDFTGGTVDALVNAMWVGRNSSKANSGSPQNKGTFTLGAGSFVVNNLTNAMLVTNYSAYVTGTINVNAPGTLTVKNNLAMGVTNSWSGVCQGALNINGGTVLVNNLINGCDNININAYNSITMTGGTLALSNSVNTAGGPIFYVSLASATLDLSVDGQSTNIVTDTLYLFDDANIINIGALPALSAYPSFFPLISYGSLGAGSIMTLGTLPSTYMGYVSNDNAHTVWLAVTNGPSLAKTDQWIGNVNNIWDTDSLNWKSGGVAVKYAEQDYVVFDDQATSTTVSLPGAHTPGSLTVSNNSLDYTFTGSGSIGGHGDLNKRGSRSLTLAETGGDSFDGGISVNGGTLILDNANSAIAGGLSVASGATAQIGNNDANGSLPAGGVGVDGTLVFNRTDTVLLTTSIAGAGSLTQNGSGTLSLNVANSYTGNTTVSRGTLIVSNAAALSSSAQVTINSGATLDLTGVTGAIALNSLSVAGATINLNADYIRPLVSVSGLAASGSASTINVATLPSFGSYPSTIPLIQSAGVISAFNCVLGTLPAATPPYAGSVGLSSDGKTVLLTVTSGPAGVRPYVAWSGADVLSHVSTNWSDGQNWLLAGAPGAADYVVFSDVAAAPGSPFSAVGSGPGGLANPANINNIVSANTTISYLNYSNVLAADYQNTLLADGVTLSLDSTNTTPRLFTVGSASTDFGSSAKGYVTIAGANGTLAFNNTNGTVYVGLGDSASATAAQAMLDMSGLGTFSATISRMLIGAGSSSVGISIQRASGVVYLAKTNTITAKLAVSGTETSNTSASAAALDVGDNDGNAGPQSFLYLGQTNAIFADAICAARQKQNAQMLFNPAFSNPSAYFRGQDGVSPVDIWSLADGVANTGTATCTGVNDFTAGSVNLLANTMYIGRGGNTSTGSGTATGTFSFNNGLVNVNTLYLGYQPASGSKVGIGTNNVGATAMLIVNGNLNLGVATGGGGAGSTWGVLTINGGTVQANTLVAGANGGHSIVNLNGGTLMVATTIGAPGTPLTALNLTGGTLQLNLDGSAGVANVVATTVTTSGTTTLRLGAVANAVTGVTYPLISYTGTDPYASLSLALPAGVVGTLVDDTAHSLIGVTFTTLRPPTPYITGLTITGTTLHLTATNGAAAGRFVLLSTTDVTLPLSAWTPVLTNVFDGSGNLDLSTNVINPAVPQEFYLLSQ